MIIDNYYTPSLLPGVMKTFIAVNYSVPGPTLRVTEGDWVVVSVRSKLADSTTVHWHGQNQYLTGFSDGVPGMTQCVIPGGGSEVVYGWRAAKAGTYWYHGHMMEQYLDGLYGAIIVDPFPTTAPIYPAHDQEQTVQIMDFYNQASHDLVTSYYLTPDSGGNEPVPAAIMVNGQFTPATLSPPSNCPCSSNAPPACTQSLSLQPPLQLQLGNGNIITPTGLSFVVPPTGKTLFRFISVAAFSMFEIAIDGVNMQIVEVDGTQVAPYEVSRVSVNVAQRIAVIVDWSQLTGSPNAVFLRISAMTDMYAGWSPCFVPPYEESIGGAPLNPYYLATIQFAASKNPVWPSSPSPPGITPVSAAAAPANADWTDGDYNYLDARPTQTVAMPAPTHIMYLDIAFVSDAAGINHAQFNGISKTHNMGVIPPSLFTLMRPDLFPNANGVAVPAAGATLTPATPEAVNLNPLFSTYGPAILAPFQKLTPINFTAAAQYMLPYKATVLIFFDNTDGGEHPFHIHGHAFWVLSSSSNPGAQAAANKNYVVRDTVSVPANGWVLIALVADNPGIWAVHCHIDWHLSAGLMLELFEAPGMLAGTPISMSQLENCGVPTVVAIAASTAQGLITTTTASTGWYPDWAGFTGGMAAVGVVAVLTLGVLFFIVHQKMNAAKILLVREPPNIAAPQSVLLRANP